MAKLAQMPTGPPLKSLICVGSMGAPLYVKIMSIPQNREERWAGRQGWNNNSNAALRKEEKHGTEIKRHRWCRRKIPHI